MAYEAKEKIVGASVTPSLHHRLRVRSAMMDITMSDFIRDAVTERLNRIDQEEKAMAAE